MTDRLLYRHQHNAHITVAGNLTHIREVELESGDMLTAARLYTLQGGTSILILGLLDVEEGQEIVAHGRVDHAKGKSALVVHPHHLVVV